MKLFSDKFWARHGDVVLEHLAEILRLKRSVIKYYPFITSRGFQDVREVFHMLPEEEAELVDYYRNYWENGVDDWYDFVRNVAVAVNNRVSYQYDDFNWGEMEYWATPFKTHEKRKDDCDGYANLMTWLFRKAGLSEYQVFTAVGDTYIVDKHNQRVRKGEYHAYTIVLNPQDLLFYPVEGSWYPDLAIPDWRRKQPLPLISNPRYGRVDWMTNDVLSFSTANFFGMKFIK